jgi:hypothetical protein
VQRPNYVSEITVGEAPSNDITALIYYWRFAVRVQPPEVYPKQIHRGVNVKNSFILIYNDVSLGK